MIVMIMFDILINIENIFFNCGICELFSEIVKEEYICELYFVVDYFIDILGLIDMLFIEMVVGEYYLCYLFFKKFFLYMFIFIFVVIDSVLQVEQLLFCFGDVIFISMNSDLCCVKNQIVKCLMELIIFSCGGLEKDSRCCVKCFWLILIKL